MTDYCKEKKLQKPRFVEELLLINFDLLNRQNMNLNDRLRIAEIYFRYLRGLHRII